MLNDINNFKGALEKIKKYGTPEFIKDTIGTGFDLLDKNVGRIKPREIWVFSAYTGIGKTYLVLNLLDKLIEEEKEVTIFSTEISSDDYILKWACHLCGIWESDLERYPESYKAKVEGKLFELNAKYSSNEKIKIIGGSSEFEKVLELSHSSDSKLLIYDHVNDFTVNDSLDPKITMPLIAKNITRLREEKNVSIIAIAQANASDLKEEQKMNKEFDPMSINFGRELLSKAHCGIELRRNKDKETRKYTPFVKLIIKKARTGTSALAWFKILEGYKMVPLSLEEARQNNLIS